MVCSAFQTGWRRSLGFVALFCGLGVACSAGDGATGSVGAEGAGAGNGAGSGPGGSGEGGFGSGTGSAGSGAGKHEECASLTEVAAPVELNMFISFDKSGSMDSDDKWEDATAALKSFFQDPGTDGLRVAMRFFGDDLPGGAGCSQYLCNLAACAIPHIDVDYLSAAAGDAHELLLLSAIVQRQPGGGGGTPLHPALHGATTWSKSYKGAHPADEVVVVLVTDGAPEGCIENIATIAGVALEAYQSAGVATYAVGLEGSHEGAMNQIAAAGGTGQGIFINGGDVSAQLLAALQQIQLESSLPCQYAMPSGENADPNEVNVDHTPNGGTTQTIGQVSGADACAGVEAGWYYDDPASPTTIILCPETCSDIQGDEGGRIDVVLGCATEIATPK